MECKEIIAKLIPGSALRMQISYDNSDSYYPFGSWD